MNLSKRRLWMTLACAPHSHLAETPVTPVSVYQVYMLENQWYKICFYKHQMFRVHCICSVQRASSVRSVAANYPSLWRSSPCSRRCKKNMLLLSKPDKNNYLKIPQHPCCAGALKAWQSCVPHKSAARLTGLHPSKQITNNKRKKSGLIQRKRGIKKSDTG